MKNNNKVWQRGSESPPDAGSQSWASTEDPDRQQEFDNEPEYKKQLYRLFSPHVAKSFLQPQHVNSLTNPRGQQLLESMGGHMTAAELWRTIREDSRSQWCPAYSQQLQDDGLDKGTGAGVIKHSHPRVNGLRRAAELQQGHAIAILSANPLHDLNDNAGQEGPRRFLAPGHMSILTQHRSRKNEEFNRDPKCDKLTLQLLTSAPQWIKRRGKTYRFLTDGDFTAVPPSVCCRHITGEKCSEPTPDKTTQFPSHSSHRRRAEIHKASIKIHPLKKN
ncbi:uncharacterized protein [Heterodontus francisci]|uniref:uncharacterized protein n=1 Tax=Heterodontus francisci TaxID=7792 RepID=UPI00355B924E